MPDSETPQRPYLVPGLLVGIALLIAVLPLPYGYYVFLRILVTAGAVWAWVLVARHRDFGWLRDHAGWLESNMPTEIDLQ